MSGKIQQRRQQDPPTLDDLAGCKRWVTWREEPRLGGIKPTKVPFDPSNQKRKALANNSDTWGTRAEAEAALQRVVNGPIGGVGIELGDLGDGRAVGGIDLDTCRGPEGTVDPWALSLLERLGTYSEISPSQTGVKAFFTYDPAALPELQAAMAGTLGKSWKRPNGGEHPPAIELYLGGQFFTITGDRLPDFPVPLMPVPTALLLKLIHTIGPGFKGNGARQSGESGKGRSEKALAQAAVLHRQGADYDQMVAGLLAACDPEIAAWARDKGGAQSGREFRRIWEKLKAGQEAPRPNGRDHALDGAPIAWPEPLDLFADPNSEAPELRHVHIPLAINDFCFDTAARMGVDPTSVALGCIVSCASVISDEWAVQPKRHDYEWTEGPRLWGAILGNPSILKTPVIRACTRPIDRLETIAREQHGNAMRDYRQQMKAAKADKTGETPEPTHPKLDRYLVEDATVEALTEALRDDEEAKQHAPARKILCRQDEMSEFFANLDRYRGAGNGGGDRGPYLRLFNGGSNTIDRVGRGSFRIPSWSACFLGGIQPGPIQQIAKVATEDGLLQRFLFSVPGPQAPGLDRRPSPDARRQYDDLFPALAALHPARTPDGEHLQVVVFHADAHRHREAIDTTVHAMGLMPDISRQLLSAYGKWSGLFARLALTFHLIDVANARSNNMLGPVQMVIPEATAKRAADFMLEIALPHLLRAHRLMYSSAQTDHAQWIAGFILANRLDFITTRDVMRAYYALKTPEDREELAAVMTSMTLVGWLEPQASRNPVKPVSTWLVNPAVHVLFARQAKQEQARRASAKEAIAAHIAALKSRSAAPRK